MSKKIIIGILILIGFIGCAHIFIEPNKISYKFQITDLDNGKTYFVNSYSYVSDGRIMFYSKGDTYATRYKIVELK